MSALSIKEPMLPNMQIQVDRQKVPYNMSKANPWRAMQNKHTYVDTYSNVQRNIKKKL